MRSIAVYFYESCKATTTDMTEAVKFQNISMKQLTLITKTRTEYIMIVFFSTHVLFSFSLFKSSISRKKKKNKFLKSFEDVTLSTIYIRSGKGPYLDLKSYESYYKRPDSSIG